MIIDNNNKKLNTCPVRQYMPYGCLTGWVEVPPGMWACLNWLVVGASVSGNNNHNDNDNDNNDINKNKTQS